MPEIKFNITREEYVEIARRVARRDTCFPINQKDWTEKNPLYGHCAIVSAAAQDIFGGTLRRTSLTGIGNYDPNDSHYWLKNCLDRPEPFDPTREQFGSNYPEGLEAIAVDRERSYTLDPTKFPDSVYRYKTFSFRLANERMGGKPFLNDDLYQQCFWEALNSPCQKMKFGCLVIADGKVVASESNMTSPDPKKQEDCKNGCARLSITSRTQQDIGSCDHAEEWALRKLREKNIDPTTCELYVAGIFGLGNGLPYIKKGAVFTCPRCAKQIDEAGIKAVNLPVVDHWEKIDGSQVIKQAEEYVAKLR